MGDKWDVIIKFILIFAAIYFLGHIASALASTTVQFPDGTVKSCWVTSIGTVVCQ